MAGRDDHRELLVQLGEGIEQLTASPRWRSWLAAQSRFHHYSYNNALLIAAQRPDATQIAGFATWRQLGRSVRRGERALWILAPVRGRAAPAPDGDKDGDGDGDGDGPDAVRSVRGFRFVPVFDVSQTDGCALASICDRLDGPAPAAAIEALGAYAGALGFTVRDHHFDNGTNGDCDHASRTIRLEARNDDAQRLKTLAHELAHATLHERVENRALAELEAESTAYIVCRRLGLDTGAYSFGYLATWAGGGPAAVAAIRSSCQRIEAAAGDVLAFVERTPFRS